MTVGAHVDLIEVGSAEVTADTGIKWVDTGIALPDADVDALVVRVGDRTSAVFSEARLNALERGAPGSIPTAAESLPLTEIGVSGDFTGLVVGCGPVTDGAPRGTLLVGGNPQRPIPVTLWHMEPAAVGIGELDQALAGRVAPPLTEETRGRFLRQSPDGETLELVETGDPPEAPPAPRSYDPDEGATAANFRRLFPEFAAQPDTAVGLAMIGARISHTVTALGTLYAAAHLLATDGDMAGAADGGDGAVTRESLGPKSAEYALATGRGADRDAFWATSAYGRRLLEIEARAPSLVVSARVVG